MPGPGDNDSTGGDNSNINQATLKALGQVYASLVPQGNTNAVSIANVSGANGNSGLPFGLDVSSLLGASPAGVVAMLAAAAAKQYAPPQAQLQQPNNANSAAMNNNNNNSNPIVAALASLNNNKASATAGGLTPQQISALSAALGHQNASASTAPPVSATSSLWSSGTSHQTSNSNAGVHHINVQALLKSIAAGQPINTSALPQQPTPTTAASSFTAQQQFQAQPQQHAVFPKAFNMQNCSKEQLGMQGRRIPSSGLTV